MTGETDLKKILATLSPRVHDGEYVFCSVRDLSRFPQNYIIGYFKEAEGISVVVPRNTADDNNITYNYVAAWITLEVNSSLSAIGLTAAFSTALANENISCNVVAGYHHDHIFVPKNEEQRALGVLQRLSMAS